MDEPATSWDLFCVFQITMAKNIYILALMMLSGWEVHLEQIDDVLTEEEMGVGPGFLRVSADKPIYKPRYGVLLLPQYTLFNAPSTAELAIRLDKPVAPVLPDNLTRSCVAEATAIENRVSPENLETTATSNILNDFKELCGYFTSIQTTFESAIQTWHDIAEEARSTLRIMQRTSAIVRVGAPVRKARNIFQAAIRWISGAASRKDLKVTQSMVAKLAYFVGSLRRQQEAQGSSLTQVREMTQNNREFFLNLTRSNLRLVKQQSNYFSRMMINNIRSTKLEGRFLRRFIRLAPRTFSAQMTHAVLMYVYMTRLMEEANGMAELRLGRLTPQLIPPAELQDHLVYLNREVKRRYPNFEVKNMIASTYYGETFASAHAVGDDFFVILHIPLTSHTGEHMPVYEVTTMRVPIDPDSDEETTEILNLPPYVGISSHGESYITVDARDHLHCIGSNLKNCPVQFLRRSTSDNSCLMTVLQDQPEEDVLRNCDVTVHVDDNTTPKIVSLTEQVSLLYNVPVKKYSSLEVVCPDRTSKLKIRSAMALQVPCNCLVRAMPKDQDQPSPFWIETSLDACQLESTVRTRLRTPHNAWSSGLLEPVKRPEWEVPSLDTSPELLHENQTASEDFWDGSTSKSDDILFRKVRSLDYTGVVPHRGTNHGVDYALREVIDNVAQDLPLTSRSDSWFFQSMEMGLPRTHGYKLLWSSSIGHWILTFALCGGVALLLYRQKRLQAQILILSHLPIATKAFDVGTLDLAPECTELRNLAQQVNLYISLSIISTIVLVVYLLHKIWKWWTMGFLFSPIPDVLLPSQERNKTTIFLELANTQHSCLLKVCTVSCHNALIQMAEEQPNIRWTIQPSCWGGYLTLYWDKVSLAMQTATMDTHPNLPLPSKVRLSISNKRLVTRILSEGSPTACLIGMSNGAIAVRLSPPFVLAALEPASRPMEPREERIYEILHPRASMRRMSQDQEPDLYPSTSGLMRANMSGESEEVKASRAPALPPVLTIKRNTTVKKSLNTLVGPTSNASLMTDDTEPPNYGVPVKEPQRPTRPSSLPVGPQLNAVHSNLPDDSAADSLQELAHRLADAYNTLINEDTQESTDV